MVERTVKNTFYFAEKNAKKLRGKFKRLNILLVYIIWDVGSSEEDGEYQQLKPNVIYNYLIFIAFGVEKYYDTPLWSEGVKISEVDLFGTLITTWARNPLRMGRRIKMAERWRTYLVAIDCDTCWGLGSRQSLYPG
jgi:hypothetical protein